MHCLWSSTHPPTNSQLERPGIGMKPRTLSCLCSLICLFSLRMSKVTAQTRADLFRACVTTSRNVSVLYPKDPLYSSYSVRNWQARYHYRQPLAIGLPAGAEDVSMLVTCANKYSISYAARCGGHSYEAVSLVQDGLVIDLSRISHIKISPDRRSVQIGAGQRLGEVYLQLMYAGNYTIPAGFCAGVGISGHARRWCGSCHSQAWLAS